MGIPGYFKALIKAHPNIIRARSHVGHVSRLYVDFNATIHPICSTHENTGDEKAMMEDIEKQTYHLIAEAKPDHTYLAVDGVPPLAKMQQQRRRRFISAYVKTNFTHGNGWDRNAISPGTHFMNSLSSYLHQNLCNQHIELWDDKNYGEGESKIYEHLRVSPPNENVVIHGLDADLICLSLMSNAKHIYLMREPTMFHMQLSEQNEFLYLDIDALRVSIEKLDIDVNSYIAMCMLLGNDFLPAIGPLRIKRGGIDTLIFAMKRVNERGTIKLVLEDGTLNTALLSKLLFEIDKTETKTMLDLHKWYERATPPPSTQFGEIWEHFPVIPKYKEVINVFGAGEWQSNYKRLLFKDEETYSNATLCYLNGLRWNLSYYLHGYKTVDVNQWHYPYPYGPLARDLAIVAQNTQPSRYEALQHTKEPFSPHECLLMILPIASAPLLPNWASKLMVDPLMGCQHLFPTTFGFDTYLKQYMHEAIPRLPPFDTACILYHTRKSSRPLSTT